MIALLFACARPAPVTEPLPVGEHVAAEARAAARVPDPTRGGPAIAPMASPLPPFVGVSRATARYVGVGACSGCHADATTTWSGTTHAHAMDTLAAHQASFNPDCFRCHVTGFLHPGGYAGASTPELGAVTCEACHGPGSDHVAAPAVGYGELPGDGAACVACHTHDNSPEFTFASYWAKVRHG